MKHYYHLIGEFVIQELDNNLIIEIDSDGHERRLDASLDPRYNRDLNMYLATRKHWEVSEIQFRWELELEKASVAKRHQEMRMVCLKCFPFNQLDQEPVWF